MTTYTAEQIIRIGGSEWKKSDKHRVYLNKDVWAQLIGLETSHYNTGNISGATLDGERISNSYAKAILGTIDSVYWDSTDSQIHIRIGIQNRHTTDVATWIRDAISERVAATEPADEDNDEPTTPGAAGIVAQLRTAGRTARDIARMVGVSVSTIYRWARGVCQPRPVNAAALAAVT